MNVELGLRTYLLAMASNPDTNLINVNSCCSKQIINSTGKRQKCEPILWTSISLKLFWKKKDLIRINPKDDQGKDSRSMHSFNHSWLSHRLRQVESQFEEKKSNLATPIRTIFIYIRIKRFLDFFVINNRIMFCTRTLKMDPAYGHYSHWNVKIKNLFCLMYLNQF